MSRCHTIAGSEPPVMLRVGVKSSFPSQTAAVTDTLVTSKKDAYFNDAPTGQIYSNRFSAVGHQPYRGSHYFDINDQFGKALTRVDVDKTDTPDASWQKFLDAVSQLG